MNAKKTRIFSITIIEQIKTSAISRTALTGLFAVGMFFAGTKAEVVDVSPEQLLAWPPNDGWGTTLGVMDK